MKKGLDKSPFLCYNTFRKEVKDMGKKKNYYCDACPNRETCYQRKLNEQEAQTTNEKESEEKTNE